MTKSNQPRLGWSFTFQTTKINPELPKAEQIEKAFRKQGVSRYSFQKEEGKTGKPHFQGCVVFEEPISGRDLRELIKSYTRKVFGKGSLTYTPTHSLDDSEIYCQKDEGRLEGPFLYPPAHKRYRGQDLLRFVDMYRWQQKMHQISIIDEPDPRSIHCIVDGNGNSGKSVFGKTLLWLYPKEVCVVPLGLTSAQMKCALIAQGPKKVYLIDMPRNSKHIIEVLDTIEELKRGLVISSFYGKFSQLMMPRPTIIIFSNKMPQMKLLSMDMWNIMTLNKDKDLICHSAYEIAREQEAYKHCKNKDNFVFSYQKEKSIEDSYKTLDGNFLLESLIEGIDEEIVF